MSQPPRLPIPGERNVLITSALPYANNVPHLGNIIGCVLSADVYSRYLDLVGVNKVYVCGTDEYGTATETKAKQRGVTEQELCDEFNALQQDIYKWFDIGFDYFHRTTTQQQTAIAQEIFLQAEKNGYILEQSVTQQYCNSCTKFLADRYVAGTCPLCKYDDAKGDQCDKCSQLLNPIELIDPKCTICGATPSPKDSEHLFLDLPKLEDKLRAFVTERKANWTENNVQVTESWLQTGLQPRCITRDLKWGTKIPREGYENKVFYVWFDAPIGYCSITANYTQDGATANAEKTQPTDVDVKLEKADWEKWWKNPKEVELVQFMGVDNIPFHSIIFPCTLLATGEEYTMVNRLSTTYYLNYEGGKFSKTRGTGVFGDQAKDTGIPIEVWRYYLLASRPESQDAMFTWDDFVAKTNTVLPNNLGNLAQRCLAFINTKFDGKVPQLAPVLAALTENELNLEKNISALLLEYMVKSENIEIRDALSTAMKIAAEGNFYMQTVKPWETMKTDNDLAGAQLAVIFNVLYLLAIIFEPFMPSFTRNLLQQLNLPMPTTPLKGLPCTKDQVAVNPTLLAWNLSKAGTADCLYNQFFPIMTVEGGDLHKIGEPAILFSKIDVKRVDELRQKYQGQGQVQAAVDWNLQSKVGEILSGVPHEKNAKSYVLQVDCGEYDEVTKEKKIRTIVSGMAEQCTLEELVGKKVVVCCNLRPARFQGVQSEGMILGAAQIQDDGKPKISFLTVDDTHEKTATVRVGDMCLPTNGKYVHQAAFDTKKKLASLEFSVQDNGVIFAGGVDFVVAGKAVPIVAKGINKGSKVQ